MWWIIGIVLVLLIIHPFILKKYTKNTLSLNTDRLHLQYFFQIALFIPFITSMFLMFWVGHKYPPRWDSIGFNFFLDIQKLPLGILALSPILGAFVVYAHRSLQTEKQIKTAEKQLEEAQKKNKVDIYISQRKFIIEQLESIKITHYGEIDDAAHVYNIFREFYNYSDRKITASFALINSKLDDIHTSLIKTMVYINDFNQENSNLYKIIQNLIRIQIDIILIINKIGVKSKKLKIEDTIENYRREINAYMQSNVTNNYDYHKAKLDFLLQETRDEILILHNTLHSLFTIILLDDDISEFLPSLEKISPSQFP